MALLTSDEELCVGIGALDSDHRMIAETIADLQTAVEDGQSQAQTGLLLRSLEKLTLSHFAMEEGMMAATRYPGLARHRLSHQHVLEQLQAIINRYGQDGPMQDRNQARNWASLLAELHTSHIQREDMHFGRWMNALGKR